MIKVSLFVSENHAVSLVAGSGLLVMYFQGKIISHKFEVGHTSYLLVIHDIKWGGILKTHHMNNITAYFHLIHTSSAFKTGQCLYI